MRSRVFTFALVALALPSVTGYANTYTGLSIGQGWSDNTVVDRDGFSNTGVRGYHVDYRDEGPVLSLLLGYAVEVGNWHMGIEAEGSFSDLEASSLQIDPVALDEEIATRNKFLGALQFQIGRRLGRWVTFFSAGYAYSRFENELTDLDVGGVYDPDDSYFDDGSDVGWTAGLSAAYPLTERWSLRLDGRYFDFGHRTHVVNRDAFVSRSGILIGPRKYNSENRLTVVRLGLIYRL